MSRINVDTETVVVGQGVTAEQLKQGALLTEVGVYLSVSQRGGDEEGSDRG